MLARSLCSYKRPLVQTSKNFRRRKFAHNVRGSRGYPNFSLRRQSVVSHELKLKSQLFDESNNVGETCSRNWSSVALSRDEEPTT